MSEHLSLECRELIPGVSQRKSLPHLIAERLDVPAIDISSINDFADHPASADIVVILDGVDARECAAGDCFCERCTPSPAALSSGPW